MIGRHFLFEKRNRKGDMSILFLVILSLLVCVASVFAFLTSGTKVTEEIVNVAVELVSINEKNSVEFYVSEVSEKLLIENYIYVLENNDLSLVANEIIENRIYEDFKDYFRNVDETIEVPQFNSLRGFVLDDEKFKRSDVDLNEEGLVIRINKLDLGTPGEGIDVEYLAVLNVKISYDEVGLQGIEETINAKLECSSFSNEGAIEDCFNEDLENFDTEVDKQGEEFFVRMWPKRDYFVNGEHKDLFEISFKI